MKTYKSVLFGLFLLAQAALVSAQPVNINTADANTLASAIKGIGLVKAEAIIEYREKNGPFKSVDDLAGVKGIGYQTVDRIRESITVK